jgi:hypothetical protein
LIPIAYGMGAIKVKILLTEFLKFIMVGDH